MQNFEDRWYHDDRLFVFYVCRCTASRQEDGLISMTLYHESIPPRHRWAVVTYHNAPEYPFYRIDDFDSDAEAFDYVRQVEPETPLISLGGASPRTPLDYPDYCRWKLTAGLTEYDYRPFYSSEGVPLEKVTLPSSKVYGGPLDAYDLTAELDQLRATGIACLNNGNHRDAYDAFTDAVLLAPRDSFLWYGAGQAARFLDQFGEAVAHLGRAVELDPLDLPTILALGIAQQLDGQYDAAIKSFGAALELDGDYAVAFNSLALTQKRKGELEKSIHNYEAGTHALARRFVRDLDNSPERPVSKWRDMSGSNWFSLGIFGALYHGSVVTPTNFVSFPTAEEAEREERTEAHGGVMWVDHALAEGKGREYMPNYFNTFREYLLSDSMYATLIGNRALVLQMLGRDAEAEALLAEANAFLPDK